MLIGTLVVSGGIYYLFLMNLPVKPSIGPGIDRPPSVPTPYPETPSIEPDPSPEPEVTNATDTTPETPQFNENDVIVIEDLGEFSLKAYEYILHGSYKAEMEEYVGKTIEIATNVTSASRYADDYASVAIYSGYSVDYSDGRKPIQILCWVTKNIKEAETLNKGDEIVIRGVIKEYGKTDTNIFNHEVLWNHRLFHLVDCRIVKTK